MLKYLALLFNTIALLICQFFFSEGVTITQQMPSNATSNSEFIVELTINKGDMGGFAKLQQFIPQGLTAEAIEMKGGDFKFIDNKIKIIWMSLPSDKEFKISYKIKVGSGIGGDKKIGGTFSYIIDNVKQEVEIPESIVSIKSDKAEEPVVAKEEDKKDDTEEEKEEVDVVEATPVKEEKAAEVVKATPVENKANDVIEATPIENTTTAENKTQTENRNSSPTNTNANVICTRKAPTQVAYSKTNNTNDFIVEVLINKGNTSGFAKLVETLPFGFVATEVESAGATFTYSDQKIKYVWVTIPAQTEFKVVYKVTVPGGVSGKVNLDGVFSYIENDETQKAIVPTSVVIIENAEIDAIVTNNLPPTPVEEKKVEEPIKTATNVAEEISTKEPVKTTETAQTNTTSSTTTKEPVKITETAQTTTSPPATKEPVITNIPTAQTNVSYRVQIAALRKQKTANDVAAICKVTETVMTEMEEGYTKYTVGTHKEYKSARDSRENIKAKGGVVGPFVTAYNSGKRITVQEALMITSQKWYK